MINHTVLPLFGKVYATAAETVIKVLGLPAGS
jgi:hypothetical protein